jgi:hypothetical protein
VCVCVQPFPSLLGKVARSAGWGVARFFDRGRIAQPSPQTFDEPYLLSAPHPALRATFPASRRRGARRGEFVGEFETVDELFARLNADE